MLGGAIMQWLTALLAFATTMLMFAIIVSTLVEMIHRIFGLRAKGLRLMLENLYNQVIVPRLEIADKLKAADAAAKDAKSKEKTGAQKFADIIMENRALRPGSSKRPRGKISQFMHWLIESSMMTDIPVEVFTQKLADSRIVEAADKVSEDVIKDIAQKYEAFGNEVSTYFERRARLFSVITAFVVAWMFYVQPYELVVTYIKNPDTAQNVAAQNVKTYDEYKALTEKLDGLPSTKGMDASETKALTDAITHLKTTMNNAKKKNTELANLGAPVGWPEASDHVESCNLFGKPTTDTTAPANPLADDAFRSDDADMVRDLTQFCRQEINLLVAKPVVTLPSVANAFWLLVGGLLVGLGAPFWAQAVSSLTATRDVAQRITQIVSPQRAVTRSIVTEGAPAQPAIPPSVATFRISATAKPGTPA
ncbi:Putative uncharacterized protein [Mesorhizobium loti]|nr:Putative uncharacterized protein [Mesorhizobium loti]